jgi:hypothetical protein
MGYSHYFYIPKEFDKEKFKILSEELKTVSDILPPIHIGDKEYLITLGDGHGENLPIFTDDEIIFNGSAKNNGDCETFLLAADNSEAFERKNRDGLNLVNNGLMFDCCKTGCRPYDFMVCISLLRLKHHFPECRISSDGNTEDWKEAKAFYKKVFQVSPPKIDD